MKKTFNLIISGYGGQGIITIAEIVIKAAMKQRYKATEAELHGLAQRGGSLDCHVRFGPVVNSPLVMRGNADLIISLEAFEALHSCYWANNKTNILINEKAFMSPLRLEQIKNKIKPLTKNIHSIDADAVVEKLTGDVIATNIFMLGYAVKKNLLPLKKEIVWQAIKERLHKRFWEENRKVFEAAFK